ncbi:MAG: protein-L-isoaspartate(D-aspartate) O-methyltransferase [Candidatus Omnitrophica bacterium]|nr:protein-L-isoaspartate(D-aspartate) O-methyltransferase [Candidatus Omnitrophota bacterium]
MSIEAQRRQMVKEQLQLRGITDPRVLQAFLTVPRHLFVPREHAGAAYEDHPIPIGGGQTISQPYMVALMTQLLRLQGHERVLEVGTGSGYQLAILAELALEVYSIDRLPELAQDAFGRLEHLGYLNVYGRVGNGALGWPEHAPYNGIVVAAAAPEVPPPLLDQLADAGRLVIPLGSQQAQMLTLLERRGARVDRTEITSCVFVPLLGEYGWPLQEF